MCAETLYVPVFCYDYDFAVFVSGYQSEVNVHACLNQYSAQCMWLDYRLKMWHQVIFVVAISVPCSVCHGFFKNCRFVCMFDVCFHKKSGTFLQDCAVVWTCLCF